MNTSENQVDKRKVYQVPPKTNPMRSRESITQLLVDWSDGDQKALDKLMPLVYSELRRLASNYLRRERPGSATNGAG